MNREFKFRAWDTTEQKMVSGHPADIIGRRQDRFVIQQFTGMQDFFGKDIFEGDILERQSVEFPEEDGLVSDVIWNAKDLQFQVRTIEDGYRYDHGLPLGWGGWNKIEVIGNIYENPELMENGLSACCSAPINDFGYCPDCKEPAR